MAVCHYQTSQLNNQEVKYNPSDASVKGLSKNFLASQPFGPL